MNKSKVYFIKEITPDNIVKIYKNLNINLKGKVAVKVHSGENGNQNFIKPLFLKPIIDCVNGTVVECNTAYEGSRNSNERHKDSIEKNGWNKYYNVDIMDYDGNDTLLVKNGFILKENYVGSHLKNYDSILVLSHFKGHPMGGFGGALKQLSIGFASTKGKCWIHSAGKTNDQNIVWSNLPPQNKFIESMADAASTITTKFKDNIAFVNIMCNLSVDCDCCSVAEDPCMKDIGILASLDPVALDQACIDLIYNSKDAGKQHFIDRVERQNGIYILECAEKLKIGLRDYELIKL